MLENQNPSLGRQGAEESFVNDNSTLKHKIKYSANSEIVGKTGKNLLSSPEAWHAVEGSFEDLANHIGKGHPWMPALLDGDRRRLQTNANYAEVLAIDIDGGLTIDEAKTHPIVIKHCGLGIETTSSTPELNKFRLVFLLPKPLEGWETIKAGYQVLLEMFPDADTACKDASRFFYGAQNRKPFLLNESAVLPDDFSDRINEKLELKKQAEIEGARRLAEYKSKPTNNFLSDSDLAAKCLEHIDPARLDWDEWRNILLASHHSGLPEHEVRQWSSTCSKHTDKGFDEVWRYIKDTPTTRPVTLGTLVYLAKQNGFTFPNQSKPHDQYEQVCDQLDTAIARKWELDQQILELKPQLPEAPHLQTQYSTLKEEQQQLGQKISYLKSTRSNLRMEVNRIHKEQQAENKTPKVFELLMAIIKESCYLFTHDGETYADVVIESIRQTFKTRSKHFKGWISQKLFADHETPVNSEALESCLKVCDGLAMTATHPVFMRTANHEGNIYLDLCNDAWQAIEINRHGWRVVDSRDLPVRFVRSPVQVPLPTPLKNDLNQSLTNGSGTGFNQSLTEFSSLWDILSIAEESKPLVLAWLLSCLVPTGDKPILVLSAPKGSGKSTIARFLVNLIDSTKSALLPAVGDRRGFAVQSRHRWIFAYDNLTHLTTEQQDAMCCASTGAGYLERMLFTDSDVTFVEYRRPQILTSVDLVSTRSDLLDRCLLVKIQPLPQGDRKTNEELQELFEANHGAILGELLDLLSTALGNIDSVNAPLQRMASFHKLALAANIPNFNQTYLASVANAQSEAIKANPIAEAINELGNFNGTAQELTGKLKEISDDPKVQKLTSRTLGKLLNGTLKSDLEAVGISTDFWRNKNDRRWLINKNNLEPDRVVNQTSLTSPTSSFSASNGSSDDIKNNLTSPDVIQTSSDVTQVSRFATDDVTNLGNTLDVTQTSSLEHLPSKAGDVGDVSDIKNDTLSGSQTILQSFQVGDRLIYQGKDHLLKKLKGKVLTIKALSPDPNFVMVSCPDWIDQTVAIADLELIK